MRERDGRKEKERLERKEQRGARRGGEGKKGPGEEKKKATPATWNHCCGDQPQGQSGTEEDQFFRADEQQIARRAADRGEIEPVQSQGKVDRIQFTGICRERASAQRHQRMPRQKTTARSPASSLFTAPIYRPPCAQPIEPQDSIVRLDLRGRLGGDGSRPEGGVDHDELNVHLPAGRGGPHGDGDPVRLSRGARVASSLAGEPRRAAVWRRLPGTTARREALAACCFRSSGSWP